MMCSTSHRGHNFTHMLLLSFIYAYGVVDDRSCASLVKHQSEKCQCLIIFHVGDAFGVSVSALFSHMPRRYVERWLSKRKNEGHSKILVHQMSSQMMFTCGISSSLFAFSNGEFFFHDVINLFFFHQSIK